MFRLWEVRDNLPSGVRADAMVGMSLAHAPDGTLGPASAVVEKCANLALWEEIPHTIFSNRWMAGGVNLARAMKEGLVDLGVPSAAITIPEDPESPEIRNTIREVEFAVEVCRAKGWTSLVVVANHLHMRRSLAAFRATLTKRGYDLTLYWVSVGRESYGKGVSSQSRFDSPLYFLAYEFFLAFPASVVFGWWKLGK